uniref:Genome polyprotein n=1 Tax=Cacopsylla melanoneura TaxID=428564 RepID=A0A8D8RBR0_9HEMI
METNYPVEDSKLPVDWKGKLKDMVAEGKKVIVFCPTVKGALGTNTLAREFGGAENKVMALNRENYAAVHPVIKTGEYNIIFSTNIAECGLNADLDVVMDLREKMEFLPLQNGKAVQMDKVGINHASYIQRRGRVGRNKPGEYLHSATISVLTRGPMSLF